MSADSIGALVHIYFFSMKTRTVLLQSLYFLFRPIAAIALRHGVTAQELNELVKQSMVDVCRENYGIRGRPTNKSRIATMTNLTRVDVARLINTPMPLTEGGSKNPINRIVGAWMRDVPWLDQHGEPRPLRLDQEDQEFQLLCKRVHSQIPYQTFAKELERLNIVKRSDNTLTLIQKGFVPQGDEDALLPFLGEDAAALLDTMDFNLQNPPETRRYQRKLSFPGLTDEGMKILHRTAHDAGQKLLEDTDAIVAKHKAPEEEGVNRFSGMGIYVFDLTNPNRKSDD